MIKPGPNSFWESICFAPQTWDTNARPQGATPTTIPPAIPCGSRVLHLSPLLSQSTKPTSIPNVERCNDARARLRQKSSHWKPRMAICWKQPDNNCRWPVQQATPRAGKVARIVSRHFMLACEGQTIGAIIERTQIIHTSVRISRWFLELISIYNDSPAIHQFEIKNNFWCLCAEQNMPPSLITPKNNSVLSTQRIQELRLDQKEKRMKTDVCSKSACWFLEPKSTQNIEV